MKKKMIYSGKAQIAIFFIALVICLCSCKTTDTQLSANLKSEASYKIVKIDLTNPNLTIISSQSFEKPVSFAQTQNCDVVINTVPFQKNGKLSGILVQNKNLVSHPNNRYSALCFYKEKTGYSARIFDSQEEIPLDGEQAPDFAFGGFWTILRRNEIFEFIDHKDFRTAVGIGDEGKTLYILVGKKLSYGDCAQILSELDSEVAIEFDGGRSSYLVLDGKNQFQRIQRRKIPAVLGLKLSAH